MFRWAFVLLTLIGCAGFFGATAMPAGEKTGKGSTVEIFFANETGEPIFFFVCGTHGATSKVKLDTKAVVPIRFYDDKNDRALDAFDKDGKKLVSHFKFVPASFCVLIEKNQKEVKTAAAESHPATEKYVGDPR